MFCWEKKQKTSSNCSALRRSTSSVVSVHSLLNDHLMKMAINLQLYGVFRKVKFFALSNEKSGNKNKLTGNTSDNNNFKHQRFWKWRPFVLQTSSGGGAPSEHWCKMRTSNILILFWEEVRGGQTLEAEGARHFIEHVNTLSSSKSDEKTETARNSLRQNGDEAQMKELFTS